ncbi:BTB/POZ domain-containing adapter for CUL3-mediated RhoA degradation protein 3 [Parelaphostrongylus tenuis]|uniref:BTB/POZ domain-containing adapter for CUL3-mediated RhoA degradation protein 3 n=1 Tax=Parelaphostrongylus tenuis TaxID=148309 RepID=A0AAD5RB55_PARTN|nr:BTB/POZ domain-containing adapter for CUL3-mediated RhoA degradation protein 3 [Parelaphostrongylus tenuis]
MSLDKATSMFRQAVEWRPEILVLNEMTDAVAEQYVKLNVGGALFQTTVGTLTKHDTMLRAMFSGRMQVVTDSNGWVLIDRSGRHFGVILDFLRDGFVPLPECRVEVEQILAEARYYLVQGLAAECQSWLDALRARRDVREPTATCSIPVVTTKAEADRLVLGSVKPAIKLLINRHNNKYSYTSQSDDNIMKNLELFDRLAVKFHDRILFVKDVGSESSEVCQWKFFGKGAKRAEVCCTSIVYATDKKQTKVEFPDSKIYDEAMSILRYEERGICSRCGGEACSPKDSGTPSEGLSE